jgi:hypothetical protein
MALCNELSCVRDLHTSFAADFFILSIFRFALLTYGRRVVPSLTDFYRTTFLLPRKPTVGVSIASCAVKDSLYGSSMGYSKLPILAS